MSERVCREIIERLKKIANLDRKDVNVIKIQVASKHSLHKIPSNSELICYLKCHEKNKLLPFLHRKPVRKISGVTVIAVVTKPHPCPHGRCAYCPGGPSYDVPSAYVGREPAIMRGRQNRYDPFLQVKSRIEQLRAIGHDVDKVEIIVMGGTFPATPYAYQYCFIQRCLDAITDKDSLTFEDAKKDAEISKIRNAGITIETRPDFARERHVNNMLSMGVTRVELGVQNLYDDIYKLVNRGHSVKDVIEATRILKDAGLKVVYHLMPGLPGSNFERDLRAFQRVFRDFNFKPDMIKIYPCLVLKGTKTHEWWERGEYKPYTTEEACRLIVEVKKIIPNWIRIMRIQRDIPAYLIEAGVAQSNLRQLIFQKLEEEDIRCRCIRCREVGHQWLREKIKPDLNNVQIQVVRERASEGIEVFISAEDPIKDVLIGYLRLRVPSERVHRHEIDLKKASIIRELHVYGSLVPVGKRSKDSWQHKGYGSMLLSEAERVAKEDYDMKKMIVMSALGTKQYFKKFGYNNDGPYVSKVIMR